jgi:hypothetical protein
MHCDTLVIADALVEPPSEIIPFRTITMICSENFGMDILLHTQQDMKDIYYHWMKPRGMMDYVKDILTELEWVESIRLDVINIYPNSIQIKAITVENQMIILQQIKSLSGK